MNFRAAECVTNETLASTCPETEYRLDVCRGLGIFMVNKRPSTKWRLDHNALIKLKMTC